MSHSNCMITWTIVSIFDIKFNINVASSDCIKTPQKVNYPSLGFENHSLWLGKVFHHVHWTQKYQTPLLNFFKTSTNQTVFRTLNQINVANYYRVERYSSHFYVTRDSCGAQNTIIEIKSNNFCEAGHCDEFSNPVIGGRWLHIER